MKTEAQNALLMMLVIVSFFSLATSFCYPGTGTGRMAPLQKHVLSLGSSSSNSDDVMGAVSFSSDSSNNGDWSPPRPPPMQSPTEISTEIQKESPPSGTSLSPTTAFSASHVRFQRDDVGMMLQERDGLAVASGSEGVSSYNRRRSNTLNFVSDGGMMFEERKPAHVLKRATAAKVSNEASDPMWLKVPGKKTEAAAKASEEDEAAATTSSATGGKNNLDPLMLWDHQTPPMSDDLWRQAFLHPTVEVVAVVDDNTVLLKPRQPTLLWEQRETDFLPRY